MSELEYTAWSDLPSRKIKNLYQTCLENIVTNASYWLKVKRINEKNEKVYNPFDNLPPALEQELLDTYARINSLPEHGNFWLEDQEKWRLFITRKITRLTISEYTERASLSHISTTCRNLKYLEVKNVQETLPYLKGVSPCLKTLVSLNFVAMAHVNSISLKYIRKHCPNLRFLGLRSCFLNDKAMCQLKHISSLIELDLRDTEVTSYGVCQVLKHNPQLQNLHHPEVVRALHKMHTSMTWLLRVEASLLSTSTVSYQLRDLEFEISRKDCPGMLAVVATFCPAVERVRIEVDAHAPSDSLAPIAKLVGLTELDIQSVGDSSMRTWDGQLEPVTLFAGSVVPILEARGDKLRSFCLEGMNYVNMEVIQRLCPNLVSLGLHYNSYVQGSFFTPKDLLAAKPFPYLRRLLFGSNAGNYDFPPVYLQWLLSNKELEELSLSGSPLFTNELFNAVFESSCAFPHLRRLELDYCNLTADVITSFLYHCGRKSLRELSICGPFVREQAAPALCYIICEKLDVQLEAYFYSFVKLKKRIVRYKQDLSGISGRGDIATTHHALDNCRPMDHMHYVVSN